MKKDLFTRLIIVSIIAVIVFVYGIKPIISKDYYIDALRLHSWAKDKLTQDKDTYDVVVYGEEPEGISAAVSAARLGARTLLVAKGKDLWSSLEERMRPDLEPQRGPRAELLSRGIYKELYSQLGQFYSFDAYKTAVEKLVSQEKKLSVLYNASAVDVYVEDGALKSIDIIIDGNSDIYKGKRFIDASVEGSLLEACKVPWFTGSGDLNLDKSFIPAGLSFEMEVKAHGDKNFDVLNFAGNAEVMAEVAKYKPAGVNIRLNGLSAALQKDGRLVVMGLEIANLDPANTNSLDSAYREAAAEVRQFADFIAARFTLLKGATFSRTAPKLYIPELRHYEGEYTLTVNDILDNRDFANKIALASKPIDGRKFTGGLPCIIGKPLLYSIPLGCTVPRDIENLFMIGSKISYSSLAASSAGNTSTNIVIGEAVGAAAVYSITRDISPRTLSRTTDPVQQQEFQRILKRQGMYLPDFDIENPNSGNWSFPAVRQLNTLGLLTGGVNNNLNFSSPARQEDMAVLLINGIYRLSSEKYSLKVDSLVRTYFKKDKLDRDTAAKILLELHQGARLQENARGLYEKACQAGHIDNLMQLRLKDRDILTLDDVYYLSAYNIKVYNKRDIKD